MRRGIRRRDRHERRLARSNAHIYISPLTELCPGDSVVLCCRVSQYHQKYSGNLADSERALRRVAKAHGVNIVDVRLHAGSGANPGWLEMAANLAKQHGAKLLAETTSRFIRHPDYHSSKRPEAAPGEEHFDALIACTHGVELVTVLAPDADWRGERSYFVRRGQEHKRRRGGRPRKARPGESKGRRLKMLPKLKWMRGLGMGYREIGRCLGVSDRTVRRWSAALFPQQQSRDGISPLKLRVLVATQVHQHNAETISTPHSNTPEHQT